MRYNVSFQKRAKKVLELLSKRPPVTLEEMRAQAMWVQFHKKGETVEMYLEKYRNGDFDKYYKGK